jgi:hypothetical protein
MPERMSWAGLARAGADARRAKTPDAICFFTVNFHVIVFLILTVGNGLVNEKQRTGYGVGQPPSTKKDAAGAAGRLLRPSARRGRSELRSKRRVYARIAIADVGVSMETIVLIAAAAVAGFAVGRLRSLAGFSRRG